MSSQHFSHKACPHHGKDVECPDAPAGQLAKLVPWGPGVIVFLGARTTASCVPSRNPRVPRFFMIFWPRLGIPFYWILVPTWSQFPSQLGPKIHQKSFQEPSKIHPNIQLVIDHFFNWFLIDFWSIFYWFLNLRTFIFYNPSHVLSNFFKIAISPLHVLLKSTLEPKIIDFRSQNPPKIDEKSIQNR